MMYLYSTSILCVCMCVCVCVLEAYLEHFISPLIVWWVLCNTYLGLETGNLQSRHQWGVQARDKLLNRR